MCARPLLARRLISTLPVDKEALLFSPSPLLRRWEERDRGGSWEGEGEGNGLGLQEDRSTLGAELTDVAAREKE